ncbi:MAG: hypothetical protein V3W41_20825 [Planctomycetota bacterium]
MSRDFRNRASFRSALSFHRFLRHLHLPHVAADKVVQTLKVLRNPADVLRRRRAGQTIRRQATTKIRISESEGWLPLGIDELSGQSEASEACRVIFEEKKKSGESEEVLAAANKNFLVSLVRDEQFGPHEKVLELVLSDEVLNAAATYLGSLPLLTALRLWWTPPNTSAESSQLYHFDAEGTRQLKFFFNVLEVGPENGPFHLIPASHSKTIAKQLGYRRGKLSDSTLEPFEIETHRKILTGRAAVGAAVDTSRCLHLGSRSNLRERVVLMMQFTPLSCPRVARPDWVGMKMTPAFKNRLSPLAISALGLK